MLACRTRSALLISGALVAGVNGDDAMTAGFQLRELSAVGMAMSIASDYFTGLLNPAGVTHVGTPYLGVNGGDLGEDKLAAALYGLGEISPGLALGLSPNDPFGIATEYESDWIGCLESEFDNSVLTPSISWKVTDKLSVGTGRHVGRDEGTLSRAINLLALGLTEAMTKLNGYAYSHSYAEISFEDADLAEATISGGLTGGSRRMS